MARPRKAKETTQNNALLEALKFLALVTKDQGSPNETHIILSNHTATAFNGVISASTSIQEDIFACPQNSLMIKALLKCGLNLAITQLDQNFLSIKSDKFKAIIPCLDLDLLQTTIPDNPIASINDNFKTGLDIVGILANENAQSVVAASILMNGQSLIATDRNVMLEYWHGINLPVLALPKAIVAPITKSGKKLQSFGYSQSSATFYFEDGSWIKTQLYSEKWPDVMPILNRKSNPLPIPAGLWEALEAVAPFSSDGLIYSRDGGLASHANSAQGAFFEAGAIPPGLTISARQLAIFRWAKEIDFFAEGPSIMAYGDRIRGVIAGRQS